MENEKLAVYYETYMTAMEPKLRIIGEKAGHEIASLVLSLKFGLSANVKTKVTDSIAVLGDDEASAILRKALGIIGEQMPFIAKHMPPVSITRRFDLHERQWLAITDETDISLPAWHLDNAIVLLYTAAYSASVLDREALDEHRNYVLRIIEPYLDTASEIDE
jgi:hypothetical protein